MRRMRFTIVHTHSSKAGILGRLAARMAGAPIIVHTVHGWSFHDYMSPAVRWAYILLERWMAGFTDLLIAVAAPDIEKGLRAGIGRREQYQLVRSAIPLDAFNPARLDRQAVRLKLGLPADALVVGNVGRFSPQKNPLDWVRVAGRIGRSLPQARFLLVGDGPLRGDVEALLAQQGLTGRTLLTGLRRDVPEMLAAMDVFLLTSLWEGLPRVIPQAMCMGLPVVATRADGSAEAVHDGETGYLCPPGDLDGLAGRCIELLSSPERRLEMGELARRSAREDYDLQVMIEQIKKGYAELIAIKI